MECVRVFALFSPPQLHVSHRDLPRPVGTRHGSAGPRGRSLFTREQILAQIVFLLSSSRIHPVHRLFSSDSCPLCLAHRRRLATERRTSRLRHPLVRVIYIGLGACRSQVWAANFNSAVSDTKMAKFASYCRGRADVVKSSVEADGEPSKGGEASTAIAVRDA